MTISVVEEINGKLMAINGVKKQVVIVGVKKMFGYIWRKING